MASEVKSNLFTAFTWMVDRLRGRGISRIPLVMKAYNFLYKNLIPNWDLTRQLKVLNYRMFVDLKDAGDLVHILVSKGIYDPLMTKVLQDIIKPGMNVIDIGANIGYFTLILADQVGSAGLVLAIEPEQRNFDLLERNVGLNGYLTRVQCIQVAISNENSVGTLFISDKYYGSHVLVNQSLDVTEGRLVRIKTVTLDHLFKEHIIHFVKVDVQGVELDVLEGMETLLNYEDIILLFQFIPYALIKCGRRPEDLLAKLVEHRFRLWDIDEKKKKVVPTDVETLLKKYPEDKRIFTNILGRR